MGRHQNCASMHWKHHHDEVCHINLKNHFPCKTLNSSSSNHTFEETKANSDRVDLDTYFQYDEIHHTGSRMDRPSLEDPKLLFLQFQGLNIRILRRKGSHASNISSEHRPQSPNLETGNLLLRTRRANNSIPWML